jgi:signal transduction histidine kinase
MGRDCAHASTAARGPQPPELALEHELGSGAEPVAPLVARERVLGALTPVSETPGRYGDRADLQPTEALARRCAPAADNARLYGLARDAARARDVFRSVAAHELRTPVTAVKGYARLLERRRRRGTLDAAQLEQGPAAPLRDSDRLAGLTADLLDAARLQSGRFPLRPAPFDLAALVRRVVALTAERLAAPAEAEAADGARPAARRGRGVALTEGDTPERAQRVRTAPGGPRQEIAERGVRSAAAGSPRCRSGRRDGLRGPPWGRPCVPKRHLLGLLDPTADALPGDAGADRLPGAARGVRAAPGTRAAAPRPSRLRSGAAPAP